MAIIASSSGIDNKYKEFKETVYTVLISVADYQARISGSIISAGEIWSLYSYLTFAESRLIEFRDIPGAEEYASNQEDDITYSITDEINGLLSNFSNVKSEIYSLLPKNNGQVILFDILENGTKVPILYSSPQVITLGNLLQNIKDQIV